MGRMLVGAGVAAAATVAVDQASKALVRSTMDENETHGIAGGQLGIGHVENRSSAYGLLGRFPSWVPAVGTAVVGGALLALNRGTSKPLLAGIGAGLLIGGGAGNVIDRLQHGSVTDFAHVTNAFGYFNAADVAIDAGLGLAGGALLFASRR
jgi:signal peptidase II